MVEALTAFSIADAILADEASRARICLTLTGRTLAEDVAQYNSQRYFTDLVELRVDLLEPAERAKAADFPAMVPVPVILTFRRKVDGGVFEGPESERVAFYNQKKQAIKQSTHPLDLCRIRRIPATTTSLCGAGSGVEGWSAECTLHGTRFRTSSRKCRELAWGQQRMYRIAFMRNGGGVEGPSFAETVDFTDVPHFLCAMGPLGSRSRGVLAVRERIAVDLRSVGARGDDRAPGPRMISFGTYRVTSITPSAQVMRVPAERLSSPIAFRDEDEDVVRCRARRRTDAS